MTQSPLVTRFEERFGSTFMLGNVSESHHTRKRAPSFTRKDAPRCPPAVRFIVVTSKVQMQRSLTMTHPYPKLAAIACHRYEDRLFETLCQEESRLRDTELITTPAIARALLRAGIHVRSLTTLQEAAPFDLQLSIELLEGRVDAAIVFVEPLIGSGDVRDQTNLRRIAQQCSAPCATSIEAARILIKSRDVRQRRHHGRSGATVSGNRDLGVASQLSFATKLSIKAEASSASPHQNKRNHGVEQAHLHLSEWVIGMHDEDRDQHCL